MLVECPAKAARRPYHKQKLALVLTSLRHFALEQAARGVAVRHVVSSSYTAGLATQSDLGPIEVMRPAERELRVELAPLFASGALRELPHEGWLTTTGDFRAAAGKAWRMDAFYRHARRRLGILMVDGKAAGGRLSFDGENRKPWRGQPPAPAVPTFRVDAITREVCALVTGSMGHDPGNLTPEALPATRADVEALWAWGKASCLPRFGPYEGVQPAQRGAGGATGRPCPVGDPRAAVTPCRSPPVFACRPSSPRQNSRRMRGNAARGVSSPLP